MGRKCHGGHFFPPVRHGRGEAKRAERSASAANDKRGITQARCNSHEWGASRRARARSGEVYDERDVDIRRAMSSDLRPAALMSAARQRARNCLTFSSCSASSLSGFSDDGVSGATSAFGDAGSGSAGASWLSPVNTTVFTACGTCTSVVVLQEVGDAGAVLRMMEGHDRVSDGMCVRNATSGDFAARSLLFAGRTQRIVSRAARPCAKVHAFASSLPARALDKAGPCAACEPQQCSHGQQRKQPDAQTQRAAQQGVRGNGCRVRARRLSPLPPESPAPRR